MACQFKAMYGKKPTTMHETLATEIAVVLLSIGAVRFDPENPLTFRSGIKSPVYTDNRSLPYYPNRWRRVINGFERVIIAHKLGYDIIAGIATAGIPHSSALAFRLARPSVFVRKEVKKHGTQKMIEGGNVEGQKVLLVEDLVTTGGSSLAGVMLLRQAGAIVTDCLAISSYGLQQAEENFANAEVNLHTLTNFDAIWQYARSKMDLEEDVIAAVDAWQANPYDWGQVSE